MASCRMTGDLPLVESLVTSVDCNVDGLIQAGYTALIGPGSQFQTALTVLLTLYVAILGLRLMLGLAPLRFGEMTVTVAKIGVVLALATSWPTYQQLVVGLLYDGPQELAGQILGGAPTGGLAAPYAGLQTAFDQMQATSDYFAQRTPGVASPFVGGPAFGAFAMNASSMIMLLTTLGVVLASKIVLSALLAFGPAFIALFLFDATRGLFMGWLRAAIALALAPLFALLALVFQLLLVQPHLVTFTEMRAAGQIDLAPAIATLALTSITAGVSLAGLIALGFIAAGLKFQRRPAPALSPIEQGQIATAQGLRLAEARTASGSEGQGQTRAAAVAAAATSMSRRDARLTMTGLEPQGLAFATPAATGEPQRAAASASAAAGPRRGLSPFRSASSARRDR